MNQAGVDPSDFGKAYTITPYYATSGGYILTVETGLKISSGESISLTLFDSSSPETVKITVADNIYGINGVDYFLTKHKTNENKIYIMPNANVRSGIIINRSANTPHVNEFFTNNTAITGHSKYANALVSARIAKTNANEEVVFKETFSSAGSKGFTAEGNPLTGGYPFTLDIPQEIQLKKDMALRFSNAETGYFRSVPATYRAQAKVRFDQNGGAGEAIERIVPMNQKAFGEEGYFANGFEGDNILWLDAQGKDALPDATDKYLSDYEGRPITDPASQAYKDRQFYDQITPTRAGYTFLGWSTKQVDSMGKVAFGNMPELTDVSGWDQDINYKFTETSPVDQNRTVYAVWEKDLDTYHFVLHRNIDGDDIAYYTVAIPRADIINGNTGKLTFYLRKAGNPFFDAGFVKEDSYFVGWSKTRTVTPETQVHELFTNGSEVRLITEALTEKLQLQLNEEPKAEVDHSNPWETIAVASQIANENGIGIIDLYAQYKPMVKMVATKNWYAKGEKEEYEKNPQEYTGSPITPPPFTNSNVAMVLMRTTEGKTLDPTKYEIVPGFYQKGKDGVAWEWPLQEGHDINGRKYSYLMTEFNAQTDEYTEENIIKHFNDKKTWASVYITMIGQSDYLSKYTAISFKTGNEPETEIKSYLAVATSNQPSVVQTVNTTPNYIFELKNFEVNVLLPVIHRIQTNHDQVVIDSPKDGAKYLYLTLDEGVTYALFAKSDQGEWSLHATSGVSGVEISEAEGKLAISSTGEPLSFVKDQRVYALFTLTLQDDTYKDLSKCASKIVQAYDPLPALEDVKQEPHIKDAHGNVTHHVISAQIPVGTYSGANYTLGYMSNGTFVAVMDADENGKPITARPDSTEKLTFNVPAGRLNGETPYVIQGKDPVDTFAPTDFPETTYVDLTAPKITATGFTLKTGDLISDTAGQVTTDDPNASLSYTAAMSGAETTLPEGITFDPATGKFSGKTADILAPDQVGDYLITIRAEDVYGNVRTHTITLSIEQKETTAAVTSITQNANDAQGNAVLTVQGIKDATIKLYSKAGGIFIEIDVPGFTGLSGSRIENEDGTLTFTLSQADVRRFNGEKIYITQTMTDKLESDKIDATETINRKDKKKVATGGAIVIDNDPPTPIEMVQPEEWSNELKITNLSADADASDVRDIDRIDLQIGNSIQCTLNRQYDEFGVSTGQWLCNVSNREFTETEEDIEFLKDPNTGEVETKRVGVLNYTLPPGSHFVAFQSIKAVYYDYLNNASIPVTTTALKLPEPIAPYDMTAINNSQADPNFTVISGKADPGAKITVKIGVVTYLVNVDDLGEFSFKIPKQPKDTELNVTSTLNNYTATGKVTVQNVQADDYDPVVTDITKPYGEATTEAEVLGSVSVPGYPSDAAAQPSFTLGVGAELPDGSVSGDYNIPVVVTYPDNTTDAATVKVTVGPQPENTKYDPVVTDITKPYGEATTEAEVLGSVSVPGYPSDAAAQPSVTLGIGAELPDGSVSGDYHIPVVVTYPDSTTDAATVKVTVGPQPENTKYDPVATDITKPYGEATTEAEVLGSVSVPGYPSDAAAQPSVTLGIGAELPDGSVSGDYNIPVVVTYPDSTTDAATVKVTVGPQPENTKYDPVATDITKPYGEATTEAEVLGSVSVPGYPSDAAAQPSFTLGVGAELPDGSVSGDYHIPVVVTYPDNTTDAATVKVTVGPQPENTKYDPVATDITKPYGEATTEAEVLGSVSVPGYPSDAAAQPTVTLGVGAELPDGSVSGDYHIPVVVTYPDNTTDAATVKVTVGPQPENTKYDPVVTDITKPYGEATTEAEVLGSVSVPGYPSDAAAQPSVTLGIGAELPDGSVSGDYNIPVVVTYPDSTTDAATVKVTVGPQPENTKYDPVATDITKPYGEATTEAEVLGSVSVPGYPSDAAAQPSFTLGVGAELPDGSVSGDYHIPVVVTYPDNTTDAATVKVTVGPQPENTKYDPVVTDITKPYGEATTEAEVLGSVSVPGYPSDAAAQPSFTLGIGAELPDGSVSGDYNIPVVVTYPDNTTDAATVKVVVNPKPTQAGIIDPKLPEKTEVKNRNKLTDEEKAEVKRRIKEANEGNFPDGTNIVVGDNGDITIIYPDGSQDKILGSELVAEKTEDTKVIPVGSDVNSPIPENYIRMYFDPMSDGWLEYNPTFDTGIVIAFDVFKDITWADALANGLIVPTATHVDSSYTFDKWSLVLSEDTVINNTTYRYYYFVASYKPVSGGTSTNPTGDGASGVAKTGESAPPIMLAAALILLGVLLIIAKRKAKQDEQ
ncbi:MAG: Rib/alpha-like domain-containing protein [Saccharofermentanales bacterium]